jgi:hypothetical protein
MICSYCLTEQEKRVCDACEKRMSRLFGLMHKLTEYRPLPPMRIPSLDTMKPPEAKKEPKIRKRHTRKSDVIPWPTKKKSA